MKEMNRLHRAFNCNDDLVRGVGWSSQIHINICVHAHVVISFYKTIVDFMRNFEIMSVT